jgi:hypothetical protein
MDIINGPDEPVCGYCHTPGGDLVLDTRTDRLRHINADICIGNLIIAGFTDRIDLIMARARIRVLERDGVEKDIRRAQARAEMA